MSRHHQSPRTSLVIAALAVAPSLLAGCGGDDPPPLAALESCRSGWQPLTAPRRLFAPHGLVLHGDELILSASAGSGTDSERVRSRIEAQPLSGAEPRILAQDEFAWTLWVEGDQVLYSRGTELLEVPVAGGTPTTLTKATLPSSSDVIDHGLTATDFLLARIATGPDGKSGQEVWATPRAGGDSRLLGFVPGIASRAYFVPGAAIFNTSPPQLLPLDGAPSRTLDALGSLIAGVEPEGLYVFYPVSAPPEVERFEMRLAPADGGPSRPFWPDIPARLGPTGIWADGEGGWFVTALEVFDDGVIHRSFLQLDAAGRATRVACDTDTAAEDVVTVRPAFTADAAYVVVEDVRDVSRATWRIVKVPRPH